MRHLFRSLAAALAALLALAAGPALAAPGDLDSSFDGDGRLQTIIGTLSSAQDSARQPDGKLVVAGYSETGGVTSFQVVRYNVDGSLDATFDTDGKASVTFTQGDAFGQAVALQADGKIVVAGFIGAAGDQFAVARLNANGTLDTTFGTMGRVAFTVAGTTGSLLTSMVLRGDGRIVLAGTGFTATQDVIAVAQLLTGGGFDTTFSGDGMALLAPAGDSFTGPAALQADGKLLVAAFNGSRFVVGRFNTNGSTDTTFGTLGVAIANIGASTTGDSLMGMVVQPDQRIVVAASNSAPDVAIVRFTTGGILDGSFGASGQNNTSIGGIDLVGDLLLMPDGKLMVVGRVFNGSIYEAFLLRYTANGLLDTTYGNGGHVTLAMEAGSFFVNTGLLQPDGKVVLAGQYREHFGVMRVLGDTPLAAAPVPDFEANGKSDLLLQRADGTVAVWLMDGANATAMQQILGPGTGFTPVELADMNGDGTTDIVWQHTDGRVVIWLMNGATLTSGGTILGPGTGWSVAHTGDFNGDGRADILWRNVNGSYAVWLMNGTTTIGGGTILAGGAGWVATKTADFNGDGRDDILWTHADGRASIWLMNGAAVIGGGGVLGAGSGWSPLHTADTNGDGNADIVWQHADGRVAIWLMNGATVIGGGGIFGAGTGWTVARVADFNGDGRTDLLWQHPDGRATIWLMNGGTAQAQAQILAAGGGWTASRTGDLNGDRQADIVWQNADGRVAVWLMNGTTLAGGGQVLNAGSGWTVSTATQP